MISRIENRIGSVIRLACRLSPRVGTLRQLRTFGARSLAPLTMLIVATAAVVHGAEPAPWDLAELRKTPKVEWVDTSGMIRKLYYQGEPYRGRATRVFAYCGFPEPQPGEAAGTKRPAVVLIHGGGGTAFPEWVKLWAERGYVAIAMDLAGKGPDRKPLEDGGPDQSDDVKFPKTETAPREMWSYHAVANAIRGASVLQSLEVVDRDRLAVTGISWGGYLTCIVAGVDDRFRAAVPVYGCGFLHENSVWLPRFAAMTPPEWKTKWVGLFDPSSHVGGAKMPVLMVNGTNDFAYPLDSYQKTYRLIQNRRLCVTVNMPHGHQQGWAPKEIGLFIDSHLRGGAPLPEIDATAKVTADEGRASVGWRGADSPQVKFHWTTDVGEWQKRKWQTRDASADGESRANVALPTDRPLVGFFTLTDKRGATVSTEHFELAQSKK